MGIGSLRSACSASSRLIRCAPNLAEVVPVPFEHRLSNCICNAYAEEANHDQLRSGPASPAPPDPRTDITRPNVINWKNVTSASQNDLLARTRAAREALDAWTREIVQWHFNPETGCPFWLEFARKLD